MSSIFDPVAFRRELDELLRRSDDADLHDAIWAHIEGRTTRAELRSNRAYSSALGAYYRDRFAEFEAAGVDFAAIRARVRELTEDDDELTPGPD